MRLNEVSLVKCLEQRLHIGGTLQVKRLNCSYLANYGEALMEGSI